MDRSCGPFIRRNADRSRWGEAVRFHGAAIPIAVGRPVRSAIVSVPLIGLPMPTLQLLRPDIQARPVRAPPENIRNAATNPASP